MSFKYELLKTLVRLIGFKNRGFAGGAEAIVTKAKARNAKNPIPELRDAEINVERITIDGCPLLVMTHKPRAKRANLERITWRCLNAMASGDCAKSSAIRIPARMRA